MPRKTTRGMKGENHRNRSDKTSKENALGFLFTCIEKAPIQLPLVRAELKIDIFRHGLFPSICPSIGSSVRSFIDLFHVRGLSQEVDMSIYNQPRRLQRANQMIDEVRWRKVMIMNQERRRTERIVTAMMMMAMNKNPKSQTYHLDELPPPLSKPLTTSTDLLATTHLLAASHALGHS